MAKIENDFTKLKELTAKARVIKTVESGAFNHGNEFFLFYKKHKLNFQEWDLRQYLSCDTKIEAKKKMNNHHSWSSYAGNVEVSLEFKKSGFNIIVDVWDA